MVHREMELIEDFSGPKIDNLDIKRGVKTLQDQMGCEFKGFTNRLNFQEINDPVSYTHLTLPTIYSV